MQQISKIVLDHKENLVRGEPQLNMCDESVMNWAPPGCDSIKKCLQGPKSNPYKCTWPH